MLDAPPKNGDGLLPPAAAPKTGVEDAPNAGVVVGCDPKIDGVLDDPNVAAGVDDAPNPDEPNAEVEEDVGAVVAAPKENADGFGGSPSFFSSVFDAPKIDGVEVEAVLPAPNPNMGLGASLGLASLGFAGAPNDDDAVAPPKADTGLAAPNGEALDVDPNAGDGVAAELGFAAAFPNENADLGASVGFAVPFPVLPNSEGAAPDALDAAPNGLEVVLAAGVDEALGPEPNPPKIGLGAADAAGALLGAAPNGLGLLVAGALLVTPKLNLGVEVVCAGADVVTEAGAADGAPGAVGASGLGARPKSNFGCVGAVGAGVADAAFEGSGAAGADGAGVGGAGFANENVGADDDACCTGGCPMPRRDNKEGPGLSAFAASGAPNGDAALLGC